MPDEIDLNEEEEQDLERAWEKLERESQDKDGGDQELTKAREEYKRLKKP